MTVDISTSQLLVRCENTSRYRDRVIDKEREVQMYLEYYRDEGDDQQTESEFYNRQVEVQSDEKRKGKSMPEWRPD